MSYIIEDTYSIPWELLGIGASRYDAQMNVVDPWYRLRLNRTLALIPQKRTEHFSVLDLGCGIGLYDFAIARRWPNSYIQGVDINQQQIEFASRKVSEIGMTKRLHFLCADVMRFKAETNYWDVVLLTDIIEHLENPIPCLQVAHRAVRPDGRVIISVPLTTCPREDWWFYRQLHMNGNFSIASSSDDLDPTMPIFKFWHKEYTIDELHSLLRQLGFVVIRTVLCRFPLRKMKKTFPRVFRPLLAIISEDENTMKSPFDMIACALIPARAKTCIIACRKIT